VFKDLLETFEKLESQFEGEREPVTDIEAVIRIELANILGRAGVILRALATDESLAAETKRKP
jgi:hypothetical protein